MKRGHDKSAFGLAFVLLGAALAGFAGCSQGSAAHPDLPPGASPASVTPEDGATDPGTEGPSDCIEPACLDLPLPPSPHAVRLSHEQWESTTRDLLRLPAATGLSSSFPPDPAPPAEQFGRDVGSLQVTTSLWKEYQRAAEQLADLVATDPTALDAILPAAAKTGTDTAARLRAFLTDFLPRAYRRPVTPAEIDAVAAYAGAVNVEASDGTSDPFVLRVKWAIAQVLQSPLFLYRVEGGEGAVKDGRARLGPYELASKLSYALWGTMPDEALTARAASGELATDAGVAKVARDMLDDDRADATLAKFHDELFLLERVSGVVRATDTFPRYYPEFGRDALEDLRRTVRDLVIDHPGGVKDLYTSTVAYMNADLAKIYDVDPSSVPALAADPEGFARVAMDPKRKGVLSHAGWLAMQGKQRDPATILRGVYVVRHVLCIPLGNPPPEAAGKDPSQISADTDRERVAGITAGCGDGCHGGEGGLINPLGFSFEGFDALGAERATDNGHPVDTTGMIAQLGSFTDAADMLAKASESPRAHACYAAHWSAYLNGTTKLEVRQKWLSPIIAKSMKGASVRDIIVDLVQTDAFLTVSR